MNKFITLTTEDSRKVTIHRDHITFVTHDAFDDRAVVAVAGAKTSERMQETYDQVVKLLSEGE